MALLLALAGAQKTQVDVDGRADEMEWHVAAVRVVPNGEPQAAQSPPAA